MRAQADIQGVVFKESSAILLARVVGNDAQAITQADLASVAYNVSALDENDPDAETPVTGHEDVSLTVGDVVFNDLQTDDLWSVDDQGYNFKHELDVTANQAFAQAGIYYRVRYELAPVSGQVIVVRFKLRAI